MAAAADDYEQDDDFQFFRKSKRPKTDEPEPAAAPPAVPTSTTKKAGRGRPPKARAAKAPVPEPIAEDLDEPEPPAVLSVTKGTAKGRPPRRKAGKEPIEEEPKSKAPKTAPGRSTRPTPDEASRDESSAANGATRGGKKGRGRPAREAKELPQSPAPMIEQSQASKITLPMSDTPVINRNKEMRKKGGANRRSSLGSRGRRASSLIENGSSALPHREVKPADFYKHIEAEGLPEPRRMKQLLTWCGERALSEKPPHGTLNSSVIHGARAIQEQLLKDFGAKSEFSNWFSRDEGRKARAVLKPNPRNTELDEKLVQLEENVKRLQEEKKSWQAIRKPPTPQPGLLSDTELETGEIELPDFSLLDDDDVRIRNHLSDSALSFAGIRAKTEERLRQVRASLEFQVDQLADNVHKLEQRVLVAGDEASMVLKLSAARLKEREERERKEAGTKDMPIMEVLRSLGSILPDTGG
ncbi:uncharacterized protein J7T54_006418 [Emericellopsis cladophorae]|uniref:Kinetochore protein mis13 n=1 Tax=Emericellopsis cladophorae TaxID=2686198 RepID=A0A9P9Y792_9HYPO|nr:uncharacterized protein J7T54_006418 [Emericellopsis cladophorae]KAI6784373.1 hypothetical protein J7T54_006418 [Emericellopsis cladophorae]